MKSLKYFLVKRILIILLLAVNGNVSAATDCNNHHEMPSLSSSKYNITSKLILSSNPAVQIHVVKLQPKNGIENNAEKTIYVLKQKPKFNGKHDDMVSKENALKSIINALKDKTPTNHNYVMPPVHSPPTVNHYVPKQNVNNHFVYNIQNHGIHHHYYGSPAENENIQMNFVPLKSSNPNEITAWINDIPAQK